MADAAGSPNDDSAEFVEQAKWLLEWHNKRSEAFTTRAVALLGFIGVILALLLQGADLKAVEATGWTWAFLIGSTIALLVSALFALLTIVPSPIAMPSVAQLRHWWKAHAAEPQAGTTGPQIAESLLFSGDLSCTSPVSAAKDEADSRATRFKVSIWAALIGFGFLAALLFNVLHKAWGR